MRSRAGGFFNSGAAISSGKWIGINVVSPSLVSKTGTAGTELLRLRTCATGKPTGTGGNYFLTGRDSNDVIKFSADLDGRIGVGSTGTGTTTHLYSVDDIDTGLCWNDIDDISLYTGGLDCRSAILIPV